MLVLCKDADEAIALGLAGLLMANVDNTRDRNRPEWELFSNTEERQNIIRGAFENSMHAFGWRADEFGYYVEE